MQNTTTTAKFFLIATVTFTLICGLLIWLHPPALYPDPSWGFQVMRGMRMGGGFNMLPNPDINDIIKNNPSFLSWWSPGQYLLPYLFISIFKVNTGHAIALTVIACSLLGLWGWHKLFVKLGFTPIISAMAIAFIACQEAYMVPYVFYNGGEILLFAFAGWFLYGCSSFTKVGWLMAGFVLLSGLTGFFCKSSFLWVFLSGSLYLWIRLSSGKKITQWLLNGLGIGIPAILSLVIIYVTYLSKGENPTSGAAGINFAWPTFTFPLASPLLAGLSFDDLTGGLIYHNGPGLLNPTLAIIVVIILAIISMLLVFRITKLIKLSDYKLMLLLFYGIAILFFGISFLRQANISYEARHLRLIGLIITPGILYLVGNSRIPYKALFGLLWLFIAFSGAKFFYKGYHRNTTQAARGNTGVAQLFIDEPTLNYVTALDQQQRNAIFVFISSDIGLEIKHNRIITFNPLNDDLFAENFNIYYGHAGPIYIVLPANFKGIKAKIYQDHFPGYHNFSIRQTSKKYLVYSAQ